MKYGQWFTSSDVDETNYKILIDGKNAYIESLENKIEKYRSEALYFEEQNRKLQETIQKLSNQKGIVIQDCDFDIENQNVFGIEYFKEESRICISYIQHGESKEWYADSSPENYQMILNRFREKLKT